MRKQRDEHKNKTAKKTLILMSRRPCLSYKTWFPWGTGRNITNITAHTSLRTGFCSYRLYKQKFWTWDIPKWSNDIFRLISKITAVYSSGIEQNRFGDWWITLGICSSKILKALLGHSFVTLLLLPKNLLIASSCKKLFHCHLRLHLRYMWALNRFNGYGFQLR